MKIIKVDETKILETSKFASEVFFDYYHLQLGDEQANYMVNLFLSEDAIKNLMDKGAIFKVVVSDDNIIGFTEYIKEDDRTFLSKLYVDKKYRGNHIGKMMFEDCLQYTKDNNLRAIYLTVNKYNTPSFEIYKHLGFKVIDSVVSDIGHNYVMDDYIMELEV